MTRVCLALVVLVAICGLALVESKVNPNAPLCPPLVTPRHANFTLRPATPTKALLATYRCDLGWQLQGNETTSCRRSGVWSHRAPNCTSIGSVAYQNRSGLSSQGLLSLHDEEVILGLADAAQREHRAVGFQVTLKGEHRVHLLREHKALAKLIPSRAHATYLFAADGTLRRHIGFKVRRSARLRSIEFATDAAVLKGLTKATAAKREKNFDIVGFSIAKGKAFRASLLGWDSMPLKVSKKRHSFILRDEVERNITGLGCFNSSSRFPGRGTLRSITDMPKNTSLTEARMVCASISRQKNHRYFALSGNKCASGNNYYARYGRVPPITSVTISEATCAISERKARKLNITDKTDLANVVGAGAAPGFFHTFMLRKELLAVPDIFNGGFEDNPVLIPIHNDSSATNVTLPAGHRQSIVIGTGKDQILLRDWNASTTRDGEIGLATFGSAQLANQTVPEGSQVLYIASEGSITQTLLGLEVGKKYTLRFAETFRRDQAAGMTLRVTLGTNYVLYQNAYVSIPVWTQRRVHFKAPAEFVNITFTVLSENVERFEKASSRRKDAAVLLDAISVSRRGFASVRRGYAGKRNHGRVATFTVDHPKILAAFAKVVKRQTTNGYGGIGFRVVKGAVATVGFNDFATLKPHEGGVVYLNNGTVLQDVTTRTHSGFLSVRHPWVLRAVARAAQVVSNSVAFSVRQDSRRGVRIVVLSESARPLVKDERYNTYFFDTGIADLGCWAPPQGGSILRYVQPIRRGPVSEASCAAAARNAEHEFFALQIQEGGSGASCFTGHSDFLDRTDDLYYTGGRSRECATRCANGRDNCGGVDAAHVFRLPLYSRVSHNGHASVYPLRLAKSMRSTVQDVFDKPGASFFSTVSQRELKVYQKAQKQHADAVHETAAEGFDLLLTNSTTLQWAHPLQYHFGGTQKYAVTKYVMQAPALTSDHPTTPTAWTFEGSMDGLTWKVLDRQSHVAFYTGQKRAFQLRNARAFHFHRLLVTENGGVGVAGFGLQGLTLYARRDKVRFLKALYQFEVPGAVGWDSSFKNNDLRVLGGVINGTDANLLSVFNITQRPSQVRNGLGALRISNDAGSLPSYLAVDDTLSLPDGVPTRGGSFGVAFWFFVNSTLDDVYRFEDAHAGAGVDRPPQFSVISWGSPNQAAHLAANQISLDSEFKTVLNSFGAGDAIGLQTPGNTTDELVSLHDKWHHYAVSFDSVTGAHRVWLDTKLVASRLFQDPQLSVAPERFLIGVRELQSMTQQGRRTSSDEFNGLLDDIAIFNGPFNNAVVKEIASGVFTSYLPIGCQAMSDEYQIESGVTWGRAPNAIRERYLRKACYTKPTNCQTISDQYAISPNSTGTAGYYARKRYERMKCATWPSILTKRNVAAVCPAESQVTRRGVNSRVAALAMCNRAGAACQAYVWGGKTGNVKLGIKPYQLNMCSVYLNDLVLSPGVHSTTRVSKYLLHPDSKMKCDAHALPTHNLVPTSIHARWLCDSTPGCTGYVWSGVRGAHSNGRAATPGRCTLCGSGPNSTVYPYPGSGYEVGEKLGSYLAMPERFARCSDVALLSVVNNVTSSLAARRECDKLDGLNGAPKCASYAWVLSLQQVRLCASVPQISVRYLEGVETGLATPTSCQEMSDSWGVEYGKSWGWAPFEIRSLFHAQACETKPRSCQQLSNAHELSPNVTAAIAAQVPGTIRDLWLRQSCLTFPELEASHYFISATYEDLQAQVDQLKKKITTLNRKLRQADDNSALTRAERESLAGELNLAKRLVQQQLDDILLKQQTDLAPMLQRAANYKPTIEQTKLLHDLATKLKEATPRFQESRT